MSSHFVHLLPKRFFLPLLLLSSLLLATTGVEAKGMQQMTAQGCAIAMSITVPHSVSMHAKSQCAQGLRVRIIEQAHPTKITVCPYDNSQDVPCRSWTARTNVWSPIFTTKDAEQFGNFILSLEGAQGHSGYTARISFQE